MVVSRAVLVVSRVVTAVVSRVVTAVVSRVVTAAATVVVSRAVTAVVAVVRVVGMVRKEAAAAVDNEADDHERAGVLRAISTCYVAAASDKIRTQT